MSLNIDIPAPLDGDSDSVVTALETAAIFAGRGDASEALRWLKRAAESSGDTGDDARTLTLARTAADLTTQIQSARGAVQSGPPPLPGPDTTHVQTARGNGLSGPPPLPAPDATPVPKASETPRSQGVSLAPRPSQPASAAMISPIVQISDRPQASAGAPTQSARPSLGEQSASATEARPSPLNPSSSTPASAQGAQRSQRWLPKAPARTTSIPAAAERSTTRPPPPSSRPVNTPTPPMAEVRPLPTTRDVAAHSAPPASRESALPSRDTLTPARDTLTSPIPASLIGGASGFAGPASAAAHELNGERRPLSMGRPSARVLERAEAGEPRLRQAARVSVVRSATEHGLYLVRVLEDGKAAPSDAAEGLLVLVDPNTTIFSR